MLKNAFFAIALTFGSACASAATTVLTFEDAVPDDIGVIHDYAGFSWYGVYVQGNEVHVGSGDPNGVVDHHTGENIASIVGSFETGTPFSLKSLYLASVDNNDNVVTFAGFRSADPYTPVFSQNVTVNTGAQTLVNFNWGDVNSVGIWSTRGFLVIDNVAVSSGAVSPVPEPSSAAMMLSAAGLAGFVARRRKNAGARA